MQRSKLAAAGLAATVLAATAVTIAATASAQSTDVGIQALPNNWYASAPYLMPLSNQPPDPTVVMSATGQKAFQLAFILAPNGGGCSPTWGGINPISSDSAIPAVISTIRGKG